MLSMPAFHLLNIIVTGEVSAHELRGTLAADTGQANVGETLKEALIELGVRGFVRWRLHEDYGSRPEPPLLDATDQASLARAWSYCFGSVEPRGAYPGESQQRTITLQVTPEGKIESEAARYQAFLPELRRDFGWDC